MIDLGRIFAIAAAASVALTNFAKADDQLMQGVKSFVCDGKPIVLLGSGTEWVSPEKPELEVHKTKNGWRLGDQGLGFILFLRQRATDDWVLETLSEDGFEEIQCIDVTEATSIVVSAIRPRLNENIIDIQEQLAVAEKMLTNARQDYEDYVELQAAFVLLQTEKRRLDEERARRLEEENRDVAPYRSDFMDRLREDLTGQEGVRVVGDRFVFSSEVLFELGEADLSSAGQREIAKFARILRTISDDIPPEIDWIIRVDGHTDNIPIVGNADYADNWELSQGRALSVVRYLISFLGIEPERLSANGFGEYQPVNPADTPEARAQNRRIELMFTER